MSQDPSPDSPVDCVRFAVFDAETTSLDPKQARIVALGGVAVVGGEIRLDDSLELLIRQSYNSPAVTVHGITREESLAGVNEEEAARAALEFLEGAVLVGHHVDFDATVLDRACERNGLAAVSNPTLDTASLALLLAEQGVLPELQEVSLDALLRLFAIEPHDRHTAAGDAFLTAMVFQRLLRVAGGVGRTTLSSVSEKPSRQTDSA